MKLVFRFFLLSLKKQCRNPFFLGLLLLFPLLSFGVQQQFHHSAKDQITVLLASDASDSFIKSVLTSLTEKEGQIQYRIVSKDHLLQEVSLGKADCGYYFEEDLLDKLLTGKFKNSVSLYVSEHSEFHTFTKEAVHGAIFHAFSPYFAAHFIESQERYKEVAHLAGEEINLHFDALYKKYENTGLVIQTIEGEEFPSESKTRLLFPLKGICGLFLSGVVLFAGASYQRVKEEGKSKSLPYLIKKWFFPCSLLAAYMPCALSCLLALSLCQTASFGENILALIMYFPVLLIFSYLLILCTRRYAVQLSFLPFYLLGEMILTPIFWNLSAYFEIIRFAEKCFPAYYFLLL